MANLLIYPGNRLTVRRSPTFLKAILLSGIVAGTLQLSGMMLVFWLTHARTPVAVLQFIASGICGNHAFEEGIKSTLAGLFMHCMFSLVIATVYLVAYSWMPFVRRHPVRTGLVYGLLIWLFMYGAVIPLSHVSMQMPDPLMGILTLLLNVGLAGLPIGLVTHYTYYAHKKHLPDITDLIWHT